MAACHKKGDYVTNGSCGGTELNLLASSGMTPSKAAYENDKLFPRPCEGQV